jgi:hypothetical protein
LQAKVLHGWPDNSFKIILDILQEFMPEGVNLPGSYYEAQKILALIVVCYSEMKTSILMYVYFARNLVER